MTRAPGRRLDDPPLPGAENMARDEALLATRCIPTLRFYRWEQPTVSLGYFQAAADLPLDHARLAVLHLQEGLRVCLCPNDQVER